LFAWFLLAAMVNLIHSCYYYKVTKPADPPPESIIRLQNENNFIILQKPDTAWQFTDIIAEDDTIKGKLSILAGHEKYKTTNAEKGNRYKKNTVINESDVLNDVLLYITDSIPSRYYDTNRIAVPLTALSRIDVYDRDAGRTTASWILGGLGTGGAVFGIVMIIVLLTKESCPFIYVTNNNSDRFIGEIYSGAIYPSLERHDYLPLPEPVSGQKAYSIKMTNEVREIQNTNLIELLVFDHPENTRVLIDRHGNIQTLSNPVAPVSAVSLEGIDVRDIIVAEDSMVYLGKEITKDANPDDGIILNFMRPPGAASAKLVVKARNSFWLDYIFTRFHGLFGKEYNCWVEKQEKIPDKKMKNWNVEQKIPLLVSIERNGKWEFVDFFNVTGPMAAKEDVMAIDLSGILGESVRLKLEYGFKFWEIDYAALDFSGNNQVSKHIANFKSAIDSKKGDVMELMAMSDTLYYVQPEIGDEVNMNFELPEPVDASRSVILHSKGYYKILLESDAEQQTGYLLTFRKKGRFSEFSNEVFQQHYSQGKN